jgi:hypothetical protein
MENHVCFQPQKKKKITKKIPLFPIHMNTEPGGFLQWIEADVTGQRVISSRPDIPRTASESLNKDGKEFLSSSGLSYE